MMEKKLPDNDELQVTLQQKGKESFAFICQRRYVFKFAHAMNLQETKSIKPIEREKKIAATVNYFKTPIQTFHHFRR